VPAPNFHKRVEFRYGELTWRRNPGEARGDVAFFLPLGSVELKTSGRDWRRISSGWTGQSFRTIALDWPRGWRQHRVPAAPAAPRWLPDRARHRGRRGTWNR